MNALEVGVQQNARRNRPGVTNTNRCFGFAARHGIAHAIFVKQMAALHVIAFDADHGRVLRLVRVQRERAGQSRNKFVTCIEFDTIGNAIVTADGKEPAIAVFDILFVFAKHVCFLKTRHRSRDFAADADEFVRCRAGATLLGRRNSFVGMAHADFYADVVVETALDRDQLTIALAVGDAIFRMNNLTE